MNYCTLFNSHYLCRGLALYRSLINTAKEFHLTIFAFDDEVFFLLKKLNLSYTTIVSPNEFETSELLNVKSQRTTAEYCWTCTPSVILHCLEKFNLPAVCYLDADLYFWRDPNELLYEAKEASVLITEHRYTKEYDQTVLSGKYCVQFMYFKNDKAGLNVLTWWRDACIDWCYNRAEDGKFGDQKYLDEWPKRFQRVKVLGNLGGGVAPWNVQQYEINRENSSNAPTLIEKATSKTFALVFYHFHALKFVNNKIDCSSYKLSPTVIETIYKPYITQLLKEEDLLRNNVEVSSYAQSINPHGRIKQRISFMQCLRDFKKKWMGIYNIYSIMDFKY